MITVSELKRLVASDRELAALGEASEKELEAMLGMEFAAMKGYNQNNPHHCYDLLEHTLRVALGIAHDLEQGDLEMLRIAALFHDIGKPAVAFKKNGRTVFYNHAQKSVMIAQRRLREIGFDSETVAYLSFFIENHDMFISFSNADACFDHANPHIKCINAHNVEQALCKVITEAKAQKKYVPSGEDFLLLMFLCFADAGAQSREVYRNGKLIATRAQKLADFKEIRQLIAAANE